MVVRTRILVCKSTSLPPSLSPSLPPFLLTTTPSPLPPFLFADLALALQLQAEEERALNAARRAAAARDQRQQGQYRKVSVSYHGVEEGGRYGGWGAGGEEGRRVLLSAENAPGSSSLRPQPSSSASTSQEKGEGEEDEEEGEEGGESALGGLVGIAGPGGGRRRRQKQGELWVTKEGVVISKHDATVNGRLNALELTAQYSGVGDLEGEVREKGRERGREGAGEPRAGFGVDGGSCMSKTNLFPSLPPSLHPSIPPRPARLQHSQPRFQPASSLAEEGRHGQGHEWGGPWRDGKPRPPDTGGCAG